jgi:hypothetical protein
MWANAIERTLNESMEFLGPRVFAIQVYALDHRHQLGAMDTSPLVIIETAADRRHQATATYR